MNLETELKKLKLDEGTKEETPKIGEDQVQVPEIPQLNHVVTGHIAKFVDSWTLKAMRKVSKIWGEGSRAELKKRSNIMLRTRRKVGNEWNLKDFIKTTEKLQPIKSMLIEVLEDPFTLPRKFNPKRKTGREKEEEAMFNDILRFVAPDLEHLVIGRGFSINLSTQLPKLVKLVLSESGLEAVDSDYKAIYEKCPNVTELVIENWLWRLKGEVALSPLLNADGSRNTLVLPKLSALTCLRAEDLKFFITFPQTWTKLELRFKKDMLPDLQQFLEKTKGTLVSLMLKDTSYIERTDAVVFDFPACFPRLEKLEINYNPLNIPAKFRIRFGGKEEVNYSKALPALKTLSIYVKNLRGPDVDFFWKNFLEKDVCATLNILEINVTPAFSKSRPWVEDESWDKQRFPNLRVKNIKKGFF